MATKRPFEALPGLKIPTTGNFTVQASTSSTSPTTGALTVTGDAGIAGSLNLGGRLYIWNSANTFFSAFSSSATANTIYTFPSTSPSTGSSVLQSTSAGVMSWVPMVASGGGAGTVNNGISNQLAYYDATGTAVTGASNAKYFPGIGLSISDTSANFGSTYSGALQVTGGVGIGGTLFVSSAIILNIGNIGLSFQKLVGGNYGAIYSAGVTPNATNYTMITDGASVNFNGTSGVYFNISNSNKIQVTTNNINIVPVAASTSSSTGALTVAGGVGIGGSLFTSSSLPSSISGVVLNNTVVSSGSWAASAITAYYGGTGLQSSFAVGDILYANTPSTWGRISSGSAGSILYSAGSASTPYWGAPGVATINLASTGTTNQAHYIVVSRSATGSGIAISTDSNISVNPSTDTLTVGGLGLSSNLVSTSSTSVSIFNSTTTSVNAFQAGTAISVGAGTGTFSIANSNVRILSSTASSNVNTGSLIVGGGLGVGGQLSFSTASLGYTGVPSTPIMNFIGSGGTSPIQLSVYSDSSLSFEGYAGQLFSIDNNLSSGEIFSVNDISGLPVISASAGQTVNINQFGGITQIGNGIVNSNSTTTGSLVIIGGLGITGNAYIGGTTNITNGSNSTSTTSGSLVVIGGVGITGNANIGGTLKISQAVNSSSTITGSLVVLGGVGFTGNAFIGGTTTITSATASTNFSSGALVVSGGVGIGQSLYVAGALYFGTNTFAKSGVTVGDIVLDNGTNDSSGLLFYYKNNTNFGLDAYATGSGTTRFRIVKDLNESGGSELWSIDRSGVVTRTGWDVGETVNTRMYNYTDLNMSATTTVNSTSYTNIATITYTPKSSTSYLWIEFNANYDFSDGTTTDDFWSRIMVGGSEIAAINQRMVGQVGGGTRSGTLFPISARHTNSSTSGIAITIQAKWGSADDAIRVYGSTTSGYMRIQEIGR